MYESPEDALRAAVQALGGSKKVGHALWPAMSVDAASRKLLDCINAGRAEKLDVSQVMWIFRQAHEIGEHAPFMWFCAELGYEARAITPTEERDRLTTVIERATGQLAGALAALERMQGAAPRPPVRLHDHPRSVPASR